MTTTLIILYAGLGCLAAGAVLLLFVCGLNAYDDWQDDRLRRGSLETIA